LVARRRLGGGVVGGDGRRGDAFGRRGPGASPEVGTDTTAHDDSRRQGYNPNSSDGPTGDDDVGLRWPGWPWDWWRPFGPGMLWRYRGRAGVEFGRIPVAVTGTPPTRSIAVGSHRGIPFTRAPLSRADAIPCAWI